MDDSPAHCAQWAKEGQCLANPGYMLSHCQASCHSCDSGNFTGWRFNATGPHMLSNGVGDDAVCLDARGQLPGGHGGGNMLHTLPCDPSAPSQRWHFNGSGGVIQAMSAPATAAVVGSGAELGRAADGNPLRVHRVLGGVPRP